MKLKPIINSDFIDTYQKIVVAHFDGHKEEILYKGYKEDMPSNLLNYELALGGIGTVSRHPNRLYIVLEENI